MRGNIKVQRPESLFLTLELTMQYKEWEALNKQLGETHPSWQLSLLIDKLLRKVAQEIEADTESVV